MEDLKTSASESNSYSYSGGGENCAETAIDIVKLASVRINGMIERLQLSQQIRENVCCLFHKILLRETALFSNRHIDQIILCCLYAVGKIFRLNLTFKEIINNYRKQPQCKPQVFKSVFVGRSAARRIGKTGKGHVDIITFYNEIFIPTIKPLLVEIAPAGNCNQISEATNNNDNMSKFPSLPKKWLWDVICSLPSGPTAELESFLSKCGRSVSHDVVRRAHIILEAIFPCTAPGDSSIAGSSQSTNLIYNIWAEQRRLETVKLYYRVLLAICTAEAQILNADNLTSLLTSERFHRCMLVCSAELVLATYNVTMFFPLVLESTGITAFDLSKVIENFITHEELLPRELSRHLNSLEERLLESVVWEKGSSMYNSLTVSRPALSAEISHLCLLAEPMPSLDAIAIDVNISSGFLPATSLQKQDSPPGQDGDIQSPNRVCTEPRSVFGEPYSFTTPLKDLLLATNNLNLKLLPTALQSAFSSSAGPNTGCGGETCAETAIDVFFGKIVKLAAVRINGMIESLKLSQQIREKVCCLFQKILLQKTSLFFLRHIDQIILCCLYAVAKISHVSLTFREIMCAYRKQPHSKHQVLGIGFVDWSAMRCSGKLGRGHVDMITFYNQVFTPMVKPFLLELAPAGNVKRSSNQISEATNNDDNSQCPGSPKMFKFPSLQDMPRKKVSAVHNVYVTPLRSSKMDAQDSHSSKSYCAWVGESNHAYQSPSKDLTAINSHLNGGMLNFDEVGMVSDSFVALQIGSCVSSSSTPMDCEQPADA